MLLLLFFFLFAVVMLKYKIIQTGSDEKDFEINFSSAFFLFIDHNIIAEYFSFEFC